MINTKTVIIGALLAVIAALFQVVPVFLSEIFVLLTVFSAVPVYISSRISPRAGVLTYITASMLVLIISTHEGLLFMCTNGIVGASLGITGYYTNNKSVIWTLSSLILTAALCIVNYGMGIAVFGTKIPGAVMIQLAIIFIFSVVYCTIYYYFSGFIYKFLKRHL